MLQRVRAQGTRSRFGGWLAAALLPLAALLASAGPSGTVAIYYDGPDQPLAEGFLDAHQIENLLGHFDLKVQRVPVERYRSGDLARYRAAFFVGSVSGTRLPVTFLADVRDSTRPFCWIGRHIGSLVNGPEVGRRFGFRYVDYRDDLEFRQVTYKGVILPKEDPDLNLIDIRDPAAVEVVATAINDENARRPYALRQGKFWYFADTPFSFMTEGGRYLVFCDLLHDILEIEHPAQALALVRIEDVSADVDPADLRRIADLLASRRVPFQIAVIPIFRNPAKGYEIYLSDRPFLVDAIRYMMERGGTPVLHGVTHQYRGLSGDDYEFWDETNRRPIAGDSAEAVTRKLKLGLAECAANGISPLAFETPHYAASETAYQAMKGLFPLFYERTMATPDISAIQFFPYPVVDRFGRRVIPENLGYLEERNPDPRLLVERARNLRVVRDGIASFYFHTFLDPALLEQVTAGITGLGYRFVSLRHFSGAANAGSSQPKPALAKPSWTAWWGRIWARVRPVQRSLAGPDAVSSSGTAWILWCDRLTPADTNNQTSYRSVLDTLGYRTAVVKLTEFSSPPRDRDTLLVVPQSAAQRLTQAQQETILRYIGAGGRVVADRRQEWLTRAGFRWMNRRIPVAAVTDVLFPEMQLEWRPEELIDRFTPPTGVQQFMVDSRSRQVLALGGSYGSGRYLYLAAALDGFTSGGVSRYPYIAEYLSEAFRVRPPLRSRRVEAYFDPSFREGANLNRLAATWRESGIRTIYAAAWQVYRNHEFNYADLVRACHRNGIAIYAWFVFPAVTPKMWDEHPEWRERTATGTDGRVGWRPSMNFEDPACFRASMEWAKQTLRAHEWDGVNITELNYDADFTDYLRPDRFVPMNRQVRAEFERRSGFDPALLFDSASPRHYKRDPRALETFLRYREEIVTGWHRRVLSELEPLRRARGWEVIVTMLDSLHGDYVRPALGVDSRRVVELMNEFDFTLQVEDPAQQWTGSPDRYRRFAATYLGLVRDRSRLMFDVNVVPDRSVADTSLPCSTATGTELARTVAAAASASGRAAIYSEHTVASQDWGLIGNALAQASRSERSGRGWNLTGPMPVLVELPGEGDYYVGGELWPARFPDGVLIPPGHRFLSAERPWYRSFGQDRLAARLLSISADLLEASGKPTGMTLRYRSPGRAVMLLDRRPLSAFIDGRRTELPVDGAGDRWSLIAPRGEHRVEILTATPAGAVINAWGWLSASVITAFGAVTTVLMLAIYFHLRARRGSP